MHVVLNAAVADVTKCTACNTVRSYNVMLSAGIAVVVLVNDWRNVGDCTGMSRWPAMPPPRIRLIRSKMEPRLVNRKQPQKIIQ